MWSLKIKASKQIRSKNLGHPGGRYWGEDTFASIHLTPSIKILQAKWPTVLIDFHWFTYFDILKYALPIILKSVWLSFKNKKIWDVHFFPFFHACHHGIWLLDPIQVYLLVKWVREWTFLISGKKHKHISKSFEKIHPYKKCLNFLVLSTKTLCLSWLFYTPHFLQAV